MPGRCQWLGLVAWSWLALAAEPAEMPWQPIPMAPVPPADLGLVVPDPFATLPESPVQDAPLALGQQHLVGTKLLAGFPTGVRVQVALDRKENRTYAVEGFAGVEPIPFTGVATFGLGGRALFTLASGAHGNALLVGPGLDLYYLQAPAHSALAVAADVEIGWLHDFLQHCGWEIGLDLGVGVGGRTDGGDGSRYGFLPVVSLFTGFRF